MEDIIKTGAITLKKIMLDKHISIKELSQRLQDNGYNISPNIISNKLYRNTFTLSEYILIANALDCEVKTVSTDNKIEYVVECDVEKEKQKFKNNSEKMKQVAMSKKDTRSGK